MKTIKLFILAYFPETIEGFKKFFADFYDQDRKNSDQNSFDFLIDISGSSTNFKDALEYLFAEKKFNGNSLLREEEKLYDILFIDDFNFSNNEVIQFFDALSAKETTETKMITNKIISTSCKSNVYLKKLILYDIQSILYKNKTMSSLTRPSLNEQRWRVFCRRLVESITIVNQGFTCYDSIISISMLKAVCPIDKQQCKKYELNLDGNNSYCEDSLIEEKIMLLSKTENKILLLLAKGLKNHEIAEMLIVSIHTIDAHKAHIKEKLKIKNTNKLTAFAINYRESITCRIETIN